VATATRSKTIVRLPTRNEVWRAAMLGMLGGAVAAVTLISVEMMPSLMPTMPYSSASGDQQVLRCPHEILKDRVALGISLPPIDDRTGSWIVVLLLVGDAFVVYQLPQRIGVMAWALFGPSSTIVTTTIATHHLRVDLTFISRLLRRTRMPAVFDAVSDKAQYPGSG
jgi:hypothetical protein